MEEPRPGDAQAQIKVDLNDVFSLRRPRDCGAGLSSGLKSAAKVSWVGSDGIFESAVYPPRFLESLSTLTPTGHRRWCRGPVCLTCRYAWDVLQTLFKFSDCHATRACDSMHV